MFASCSSLKDIDVSSFNTSNVTDMDSMFGGCSGLTSIDVSNFDTSSVESIDAMFSGCKGLTSLDISNFKTASVRDARSMFGGCSNIKNIYVNMNFSLPSINESRNMFGGCTSLPGFNSDSIDAAKANYTDGYLTLRRKFWVGSNKYNADGVDAVCYDNVEFGDKDAFASDFNFKFDTDNTATYERTVSSNWATLCLPFSFTPASNKGVNCYRISNIGTDVITVDKIEDVVAAGEPILVYTTAGDISVTGAAGSKVVSAPVTSNYLTGTFEEASVIGYDTNYIISKNKFWNVESLLSQSGASSVMMAPYRAYITFIEDEDTDKEDESKAACLDIMINETDGISSVNATDTLQSLDGAEFYNAQGHRLAAPERGLVIVKKGGITRKMIVK